MRRTTMMTCFLIFARSYALRRSWSYIDITVPSNRQRSRSIIYIKRVDPYLCSELAPVLEGSGSRRRYPRKGIRASIVFLSYSLRVSIVGQRRAEEGWRMGGSVGTREHDGGREGAKGARERGRKR